MNIINGKVYRGNVTIVNGWVISGDSYNDSVSKKFDETKKESANGVDRITIDSDVNVKVSACNKSDVIAHLHGSAILDGELDFSLTRVGDEIRVSVKSNGSYLISCSSLTIDVQIPARAFEKLYVESKNADIDVASSVSANTITVDNKNGNIDVSAIFQALNLECKNGNVDVNSEARCDVRLDVTSKNGNVDVSLGNIGTSKVSVDSKNGGCKNNPRLSGKYTASGYIISKNGNARFQ